MINLAAVGYGYWGPNLVRNFFESKNYFIKKVVDTRKERLDSLKKQYPSIKVTSDVNEVLTDRSIDAIIIATPISTHYDLSKKALLAGKHVLVEKPLAFSLDEAQQLVKIAETVKKILMVDHTFLYTDAVQKIKKIIETGDIGRLNYFDSTRTNLGLFQQDVSVLWDLAAHDVSTLFYLVSEKPSTVQASAMSHTKNGIANIAFITLKYQSGLIAHFNVSWSSPVKIRMIRIGGTKKMIVYNDVEPTEKVKVYDSGYKLVRAKDKSKMVVDYRVGDVYIPKIELQEALSLLAKDFSAAVEKGKKPISNMIHGLEVVKILSLAQKSLKNGEKPVSYK